MAIVAGIKFRTGQKIYYFDPEDKQLKDGDNVIVETARGVEFGYVVFAKKEVSDEDIVPPLKTIKRIATDDDKQRHSSNLAERDNLISLTQKKVLEHNLNMKIVDAEYTFDRSKVIIYFTADNRIDFRELVKDLASAFRIRIELRQIYERDDIKLRGALAVCGRPCCCISHLQDYDKVSIKMAKLQGLSLSPGKISGCCGKLMCCLRYEYPYYQEVHKQMPKMNSVVSTPEGNGVVVSNDMLRQEVKLRIAEDDGSYAYKVFKLNDLSVNELDDEPTDDTQDE